MFADGWQWSEAMAFGKYALIGIIAVLSIAATAGGMSLQDFQAMARTRMMRGDADGDGKLSKAEWSAMRAGRQGKIDPGVIFDRLDTNRDSYLDAAEIDALTAKRFERLDANHDGIVTIDERKAARRGAGD
jgi:hypothetical protein